MLRNCCFSYIVTWFYFVCVYVRVCLCVCVHVRICGCAETFTSRVFPVTQSAINLENMISDFIIEHINHGYGSTHFLLLRGRFKLKLFKQHSSCLQGDTNAYLAYRSAFTPSAVTKWFPSLCFLVHITGKLLLKSIVPCACKNKKLNVFKQRKRPSLMDDCSVFTSKP